MQATDCALRSHTGCCMENSLEIVGVAAKVEQGDQLGSLNGTNGDLDLVGGIGVMQSGATRYILKNCL